jgi:hypothetical protein
MRGHTMGELVPSKLNYNNIITYINKKTTAGPEM